MPSAIRKIGSSVKQGMRKTAAIVRFKRVNLQGSPVVFGNAYAKSGSHLLFQILQGLSQVSYFWPIRPRPIRMITRNGRHRSMSEIVQDLKSLLPGDIAWGYLDPTDQVQEILSQSGWANYMIIRDPRDILVSHVFYAKDIYPGHSLHEIYSSLPDMEARLKVEIEGTTEYPFLPNARLRFLRKLGWIFKPYVCVVRFEDLIHSPELSIYSMLDHLEKKGGVLLRDRDTAVRTLLANSQPEKSPTFRKGSVGEWKKYFTPQLKQLFKDVTGDLLVQMGYEEDDLW